MDNTLQGIGIKSRQKLTALMNAELPLITPLNAAEILDVSVPQATQLLCFLAKKGWLSRVKQGSYVIIPLYAENSQIMVEEPWAIAQSLFEPCYIGGWSAAHHWGFTEQLFETTMVFSTKNVRKTECKLNGAHFLVKTITAERLFGVKQIWLGKHKVPLSDATKTIVDAFNNPAVVGGIRMAVDIFLAYFNSPQKDLKLLFEYSLQMKNTAIFKRIGFILEHYQLAASKFLNHSKAQIKSGYSQLDPSTPGDKLVTKWGLWVPRAFYKPQEHHDHD